MARTAAHRMQFEPEVHGQVAGYWFGPDETVPAIPPGAPTGAVLLRTGMTWRRPRLLALDLVPVQGLWLPLSEAGRYTYRHSYGLMHDEAWTFVPVPEVAPWPRRFAVTYGPSISAEILTEKYPAASQRARADVPTVQLRLTRLP